MKASIIGGETVGLITYMRTDGVQIVPEAVAAARRLIEQALWRALRAATPRAIRSQGQERAGGARGHPADRFQHAAGQLRAATEPIRRGSTSSSGSAPSPARWRAPTSSAPPSTSFRPATAQTYACAPPARSCCSTASSRSTRKASDDEQDEDGARLPRVKKATALAAQVEADAAFHRAAAALYRSDADQQDGGARHRPALHLRQHLTCCATANMCGWTRSASCRTTRAAWSRPSSRASSSRYVEYDFTADLEEKLDQISAGELDWKQLLRDFWRDFIAAVDDIRICASPRCSTR